MSTLFISDLHLDERRPQITQLLLRLLAGQARDAGRLYILGDLFEAWIGDDYASPLHDRIADGLAGLADSGVEISFIHGNRDFLLGIDYARRCGMQLLPDPTIIELAGQPALITHGDAECTDDEEYQRFRSLVRDPAWQRDFLSRPIAERLAYAEQARQSSKQHTSSVAMEIMDVNPAAIDRLMTAHNVDLLIHGHTHRPAMHSLTLSNGRPARRIVLGDWYQQGSVLRWDGEPELTTLAV